MRNVNEVEININFVELADKFLAILCGRGSIVLL